jgi:N-acylneuraminate cytidylyltransferase
VAARMKKITNRTLLLGVKDKFAFLTHFFKRKASFAQVGYVGDDVNDLANICSVGWSFVLQTELKLSSAMHYILTNPSAQGAIREVCEIILRTIKYE